MSRLEMRAPLRRLGWVLAAGMAVALLGSGDFARPANAKAKFIHAHAFVTDHIVHPVSVKFMEKLKELSGGSIEIEYHPGGDLGDYTAQFEQVMRGSLPMSMVGLATDFDPRLNIGYLAYIVDGWSNGAKLYGPGGAMVEVIDGVLNSLNMKLIGTIPGGFGSIAVRKGVNSRPTSFPDSSKGFKMRVPPFDIGVKRFEIWGFSPVPIPYAELYTALQLGTVDGRSFGPPQEIWEMRDAIGAYILTRDYLDVAFWVVNRGWWDGLDPNDRAMIEKAANYAVEWSWAEGDRSEKENLKKIADYGIQVIELSPEELSKAKKLVYEKEWPWMEKTVGKALMDKVRTAAGVQ